MDRDYKTGRSDSVGVFSGLEVEHTPAFGKQTASAKFVAIIASNAFPPFLSISMPIFDASILAETTAAFGLLVSLEHKINIRAKDKKRVFFILYFCYKVFPLKNFMYLNHLIFFCTYEFLLRQ